MPDIRIKSADGEFSGYLALPRGDGDGHRAPGMVVIQEIFGVNAVMRALCDDFAARGYLALCPDLFWRQQPDIQLTDRTDAEWQRAFELYKGFHEAKGVNDLIATIDHLRVHPGCNGKVGTVGYCLGGKLAYLMATRSDCDANVGYYGVGIEKALDEAKNIKKPLVLHIAEKDQFCPPEAQKAIKDALQGHSHVTIHTYPGMDHAFARVGGQHYDKAAADQANARTADFFKKALM